MGTLRKSNPAAFKPGCAPGPGRPRGSRSRLQEFTLQLIEDDFREHGADVLKRVRERWPQVYLTAVVGLLPRQQQTIESPFADLSDAEIEMLEEMLAAGKAKQINGKAVALEPEKS
jgi:hypothetical protein